jgi:hypothetical protein
MQYFINTDCAGKTNVFVSAKFDEQAQRWNVSTGESVSPQNARIVVYVEIVDKEGVRSRWITPCKASRPEEVKRAINSIMRKTKPNFPNRKSIEVGIVE